MNQLNLVTKLSLFSVVHKEAVYFIHENCEIVSFCFASKSSLNDQFASLCDVHLSCLHFCETCSISSLIVDILRERTINGE